ncbi:MAG TPA: response regulator [bacterium]|nr:response regulator [bacterium]
MSTWSAQNPLSASAAPPRIVIVDDEEAIVRSLIRELRGQPYVVSGFNDPAKALEAIRADSYALIISDQRMPAMTGLELLEQVRIHAPDTVRLMLTGNLDLDTALKSINRGDIFRFITKPWDRTELLKHIADGLTQQQLALHNRGLREQVREMESILKPLSVQLKQIALTDPLTGLFNLAELFPQVERRIAFFERDHQPFSLVLSVVDPVAGLDGGEDQPARDRLLEAVAAVIKGTIRREVDVAFRTGGRHFALLLHGAREEGAHCATRRLASRLEQQPVTIAGIPFRVTMSHGIAEYQSGWDQSMLLENARRALQAATVTGKAQICLWSTLI